MTTRNFLRVYKQWGASAVRLALSAGFLIMGNTYASNNYPVMLCISLPIILSLEVIGPDGYAVSIDVGSDVASGSCVKTHWMRANILLHADEADVHINDALCLSLNNQTVDVKGTVGACGGIGSGYNSIELTAHIAGAVVGLNTIRFKFSKTDSQNARRRCGRCIA